MHSMVDWYSGKIQRHISLYKINTQSKFDCYQIDVELTLRLRNVSIRR